MDDLFKVELDKQLLIAKVDAYYNGLLKTFQLMDYSKKFEMEDLFENMKQNIGLLADEMMQEVQKYQDRHGEI